MSVFRRCIVAWLGLVIAPVACAWGPEGHRIVAELAQRQLNPAAAAGVEHLLAAEHTRWLADVATWPDDIRDDPTLKALWRQTRRLHFVNFPAGTCDYQPARDCPGGRCVVAALHRYEAVLGDTSQSDAARLEALKFVVHFVGDVHQPFHAGSLDDMGGNDYQVQFQGRGTNLHSVWDSGLLRTRHLSWQAYTDALAGPVTLPPPRSPLDDPYAQWAEESCAIARDAYPAGHKISRAYINQERPVAEDRLRDAGARLAQVLNRALGHATTPLQ